MSSSSPPPSNPKPDLTQSTATIPSDSERYSSSDPSNNLSPSPEPSTEERPPPLILYSPPTIWGLLRGAAINLLLPFVNGLMLGFGELLAHEAAFQLGWSGTKVRLRKPQQDLFTSLQTFRAIWTVADETFVADIPKRADSAAGGARN
ncbi:uncharacterized protein KY384_005234 [Bacidia gigantensis]|uniref:uncharacterized protein n=1 Tax=Bacidia gigantensis TaxID=2732470 RepID=UPI001D037441|nr:uncharacterized protein KY384_005234 [Bacidia gigantensis]KAG8529753.1 hypothetical protein KY384_005234 [Bacidia gigantensis]